MSKVRQSCQLALVESDPLTRMISHMNTIEDTHLIPVQVPAGKQDRIPKLQDSLYYRQVFNNEILKLNFEPI